MIENYSTVYLLRQPEWTEVYVLDCGKWDYRNTETELKILGSS